MWTVLSWIPEDIFQWEENHYKVINPINNPRYLRVFYHTNLVLLKGIQNYHLCKFHVRISTIPIIYRVSQKHGNSVTNWKSSLLWISIVIPNFKCHTIIMSARVYIMNRVKVCKDMPIMSPQDEQCSQTSLLLYTAIFLFY